MGIRGTVAAGLTGCNLYSKQLSYVTFGHSLLLNYDLMIEIKTNSDRQKINNSHGNVNK